MTKIREISICALTLCMLCLAVQSRLPGFVSAGVIQQNQGDNNSDQARRAQPSMAANPEEMELDEEAEDEGPAQVC